MTITLNKTTLKQQRDQAKTYQQFLPSLDLKRQQLLAALKQAKQQVDQLQLQVNSVSARLEKILPLLGSSTTATRNIASLIRIRAVNIDDENVLGTKLPVLAAVDFEVSPYSKLVTPFWIDLLIETLKELAELSVKRQVANERVLRLDAAARRITQRVNLFEKVLIPQAEENIRRIVIFLSDQERAAVVRSKIAKNKQRGQ